MLSDRVLPYESQSARDAGVPHVCALASEGAYPITTSAGRGFGRRRCMKNVLDDGARIEHFVEPQAREPFLTS